MLVLTRKPGQELFIGEEITVSVVRVQGSRVQIGIDAPGHVLIQREELRARDPALHGCSGDRSAGDRQSSIDQAESTKPAMGLPK